jgi:hypothetical protein
MWKSGDGVVAGGEKMEKNKNKSKKMVLEQRCTRRAGVSCWA